MLGVKQLNRTAYHHQPNGQVEQYNRTTVTQKRHYVAKNQETWGTYAQPVPYAYNPQGTSSQTRPSFVIRYLGLSLGQQRFPI